jgi:hypothetical protein
MRKKRSVLIEDVTAHAKRILYNLNEWVIDIESKVYVSYKRKDPPFKPELDTDRNNGFERGNAPF